MLKALKPALITLLGVASFATSTLIHVETPRELSNNSKTQETLVSFGGQPAQAWFGSLLRGWAIEKSLDQCINSGCEAMIKTYGRSALKSRVYKNEVMYAQNNQLSPARKEYHKKECVDNETWLKIVSRW
jgi:hypothetical protein